MFKKIRSFGLANPSRAFTVLNSCASDKKMTFTFSVNSFLCVCARGFQADPSKQSILLEPYRSPIEFLTS
jgi:hypothetical protein